MLIVELVKCLMAPINTDSLRHLNKAITFFVTLAKGSYNSPTANITLDGERLYDFPPI